MAEQPGAVGLPPDPLIEAYKRDIDRSLLRETWSSCGGQARFVLHDGFCDAHSTLVKHNIDFIIVGDATDHARVCAADRGS